MADMKWTPGPWKAGRPDMATLVDGVDSKWIYAGEQYCAIASGRIDGNWSEVMANARLIAAAPELYQALEQLIPFVDGSFDGAIQRIKIAREALAKARGER